MFIPYRLIYSALRLAPRGFTASRRVGRRPIVGRRRPGKVRLFAYPKDKTRRRRIPARTQNQRHRQPGFRPGFAVDFERVNIAAH